MRGQSLTTTRGFTLIELMVVVAIVGVLSMLCLYTVRTYATATKTAEARNSLGQIGKDAATAYERESMTATVLPLKTPANFSRSLCKGSSNSVPPAASLIKGAKYQSSPTEWGMDASTNSGFSCLKFLIDQPQYYMYSYASKGGGNIDDAFTAIANGDLNGDQILSTFSLTGLINSSYSLNIAPNLGEVRATE
jgi:prepilin-type N-terminal cleavage/methylation domain-containing protein